MLDDGRDIFGEQKGVTAALDVEIVLLIAENPGRETMIRPQDVEGGQAGDDLEGGGRNKRDFAVFGDGYPAVGGEGIAAC